MKHLLFSIILIFAFSVQAQTNRKISDDLSSNKKIYYSEIQDSISSINNIIENLFKEGKDKEGIQYIDTLKNLIQGSYLKNLKFKTLNDSILDMSKIKKPILLQVSATWCNPCMFEIPQLNKMVTKYADSVKFIILFQDTKSKLNRISKKFSDKIILIPSKNSELYTNRVEINNFTHQLGFPSNYYITSDRIIVNFTRGANIPIEYTNKEGEKIKITKEEAERKNLERMEKEIKKLLTYEKQLYKNEVRR